tara:strand:- start:259 stop:822 length:564 start_codon:yes stop_codon:yes gene_type:complete
MVEIILVCTGDRFGEWYVNNILHMIQKNGKLKYDNVHVIRTGEGNYYDKLQMFRDFTDDVNYLYFDLDIIIKDDITHILKNKFTVLNAWWRPAFHTPINSSVISWRGDISYIYDNFYKDEDYSRVKYWRGIDEYLFKETPHEIYDKICWSYYWSDGRELNYPICLFNHNQFKIMKELVWTRKYLLSE